MNDLVVKCPKCKTEIRVTELLAAPLVEKQLAAREAEIKAGEQRRVESAVGAVRAAEKLHHEEAAQREADLKSKLAVAQAAQAAALQSSRELAAKEEELAITIERGINAGLSAVKREARDAAEADSAARFKEKELLIEGMQAQVRILQQKAEQGSQQLQGEARELAIESMLIDGFPLDRIIPVPKGVRGGDVTQSVFDSAGRACGTVLWEVKQTRSWSKEWLVKLRDDQREAHADLAVLVTSVMPKDVKGFAFIGGVWVVEMGLAYPMAGVLRQSLMDMAVTKLALMDQDTKAGQLYAYFTSPKYKLRVAAVMEFFASMKDDLDKEKKAMQKQWANRGMRIDTAALNMVTISGELGSVLGESAIEDHT